MRTGQNLTKTGFRLLLPALWWLAPISIATAEQFGDFTYKINNPETNTVRIIGYTGAGGAVVIPSIVQGKSVTSIGYRTFYSLNVLASVTIPDSVTSIGVTAFMDCDGLTNVTVTDVDSTHDPNRIYCVVPR